MPADPPAAATGGYPVSLRIAGERCLVVGGGPVAVSKVAGLREAGAVIDLVAPVVDPRLRDLPDVTVHERRYDSADIAGHRLVITATDDPAVNRQVFVDAEAAGVLVNSADDPQNCRFTLMSRFRRGALLVTVSTDGRSPAVSAWLRRRIEAGIGEEYGILVEVAAEVRSGILASGRSSEGLGWKSALDSGILELIREGRVTEAKERLETCLSSSSD
ncbi:MAG: bifunctional precorrin-2 dehydrogenase/sirohydrochlorin ferrochelatase [Acidimicrobiales bacterium]